MNTKMAKTALRQPALAHSEASEQYQTVTGYLVAIEFEERCLTLKYPPTGTEVKCYYSDEIESRLFENRKNLVQITGNVTYERDKETPKKITNIDDIQVLDLTEFTLETIPLDDSTELLFEPPLVLTPKLTECKQYMTLENTDLGIDVIAQTRDELWEELVAEVRHLWQFCAQAPDEKLGPAFLINKKNLLQAIRSVAKEVAHV